MNVEKEKGKNKNRCYQNSHYVKKTGISNVPEKTT